MTEYKKNCLHCVNIGEDIAGGTNKLFCQVFDDQELGMQQGKELDVSCAENCDCYQFNPDYGLYFHDCPEPKITEGRSL